MSGCAELAGAGRCGVRRARARAARSVRDCTLVRRRRRTLEVVVGASRMRGFTVALAESCTGGLVGHRLTGGRQLVVLRARGFVVCSNEAKHTLLGVAESVLREHGAVSAPCAERAMARRAPSARRPTSASRSPRDRRAGAGHASQSRSAPCSSRWRDRRGPWSRRYRFDRDREGNKGALRRARPGPAHAGAVSRRAESGDPRRLSPSCVRRRMRAMPGRAGTPRSDRANPRRRHASAS